MKAIRLSLLIAAMVLAAGLTTSCTDYQDEIDALEYRVTVLENLVKRVNSDITSIQTILDAMEGGDYITNVTNTDDGYIITFANEGAIVITDGKDGERGEQCRKAGDVRLGAHAGNEEQHGVRSRPGHHHAPLTDIG